MFGRAHRGARRNILRRRPHFFHVVQEAPNPSGGGLHFPYPPDAPYRCETPLTFAACKVAEDGCPSGPKKIVAKLRVIWGHASAQQLRRVLVDSDGGNIHLLTCAGEALAQREACQACEQAPYIPAAGASTVAMFSEKLLADLPCSEDVIATHVMDVSCRYSP